jgi:DNA-binding transcriptional LysR family regulator
MVSRGLGISLLPEGDGNGSGLPAIPVTESRVARDVTLAWRDGRPPVARGGRLP